MSVELKEIPVQILSMKEGDILLLRVPHDYTPEQRYLLDCEIFRAAESAGVCIHVAFVSADVDLAVVSPEPAPK